MSKYPATPCRYCGESVTHGESGLIHPPRHGETEPDAICYDCLVQAEAEAEDDAMAREAEINWPKPKAKEAPCPDCGIIVRHGENGTVYGPPVWDPDAGDTAQCYLCEGKEEADGIAEEQERLVAAAARAGQF